MRAIILGTNNSGEDLTVKKYASLKEAKKFHPLHKAQGVFDTHNPYGVLIHRLFLLSKVNTISDHCDSFYLYPKDRKVPSRVFCFYDPALNEITAQ